MKTKHIKYLKDIGMKTPLIERIKEIFHFFSELCAEEIEDIFVTDYIKEDGTRVYEELRFYSKTFVMRASDFLASDNYTINHTKKSIIRSIRIEKINYDFKKANVKSRMRLHLGFKSSTRATTLIASRENCDYLRNIIKKRYLPRICAK
jgi:hypothetical protein